MLLALFIAVTAWLLSFVMPWWAAAIPGLFFGFMLGDSGKSSAMWGFIGIGGLWLIQSIIIFIINDGALTTRMANLFSLPSPVLVILITVLIGGLIGACSTLSGYLLKRALFTSRIE